MNSEEIKTFKAEKIADLNTVAKEIYEAFPGINIYALTGDLGSGKTAFVKAFCKFAAVEDDVTSPTFSIVNEYYSQKLHRKIFHFDLYRLNKTEELEEIGFDEYINDENAIVFIEWPQLAKHFLQPPYMEIEVTPQPGGSRNFTCRMNKN